MIPLQLPSHFKPTHQTSGLPGYPAIDVLAHAGTPVCCPVNGRIVKLSGRKPTATAKPGGPYGWSLYVQRSDGVRYFLTHFGTRKVVLNQLVRRGQIIGTVADYAKATNGKTPSHIHEGCTHP